MKKIYIYYSPIEHWGNIDTDRVDLDKAIINDKRSEKYTLEDFILAFNDEHISDTGYITMSEEEEMNADRPVLSETANMTYREELEGEGFDTTDVDDTTINELADKMSDSMMDSFWINLETLANEVFKIPKRKKEGEFDTYTDDTTIEEHIEKMSDLNFLTKEISKTSKK